MSKRKIGSFKGSRRKKKGLFRLVREGTVEDVDAALRKKGASEEIDFRGQNALHVAAARGEPGIVSALLKGGVNFNLADSENWYPIHRAAEKNHLDVVIILLSQEGIKVRHPNGDGHTLMHLIAMNCANAAKDFIKAIIDKGGEINATGPGGNTPLHFATVSGHVKTAESLIRCGSQCEIMNDKGEKPLTLATLSGNAKLISTLLRSHGASKTHKRSVSSPGPHISNKISSKKGRKKSRQTATSVSDSHPEPDKSVKYELTFYGKDFYLCLKDDNWDRALFEGGVEIMREKGHKVPNDPATHDDAQQKEKMPMSKLFALYLSVSGKAKEDPQILKWIEKFLAGPKQAYFNHLIKTWDHRIRERPNEDGIIDDGAGLGNGDSNDPTSPNFYPSSAPENNHRSHRSRPNSDSSSRRAARRSRSEREARHSIDYGSTKRYKEFKSGKDKERGQRVSRDSKRRSQKLTPEAQSLKRKKSRKERTKSSERGDRSSGGERGGKSDKVDRVDKSSGGGERKSHNIWDDFTSDKDQRMLDILAGDVEPKINEKLKEGLPKKKTKPSYQTKHRARNLIARRNIEGTFKWEISPQDIQVKEKIDSGSFGVVYKGTWMAIEVAVKTVTAMSMTDQDFVDFLAEIDVMCHLRHPNVLMFLGACLQAPNLFFITPYMGNGSLHKFLRDNPDLDWSIRLSLSIEASRGILYLHHQNPPILHRDLKSLNLLVDKDYRVLVADFGISKEKSNSINTRMGTLNWLAPEVISDPNPKYTEAADIYSLGIVFWEIASGKSPYRGKSPLEVIRAIDLQKRPSIPEDVDKGFKSLIEDCWDQDADRRPNMDQVMERLLKVKENVKDDEDVNNKTV